MILPRRALTALAVPVAILLHSCSGPTASQLAALRACEATGKYSAVSPGGAYRGAYQFDRATWNGVARRHAPHLVGVDPAAATPPDQDAMARHLHGERGWKPWPVCGPRAARA